MIPLNLLNKFDNIEIQTHDKISQEDKEFCENQQFVYDKAYDCFMNVKEQYSNMGSEIAKVSDNCTRYIYYLDDIKKYIKDMNFKFLCNIYYYFERTYKLELDVYKKEKKFKVENRFNYHEIIDLIIEEIGGFSFEEATIVQLKEAIRKATQYHKIEVKKDTIVFEKLIYWSYDKRWDKDYNTYKFENFMKVLEAIQMFDTKKDINTPKWYGCDTKYFERLENPMTIDGDMLKQIKLFKNGKVEMKFNSNENAVKFAKEWCSYGDY